MYPFIVADIGGTNARFALVTGKNNFQYRIEHIQIFATSEYDTLQLALTSYLDNLPGERPRAACVAIAGPVVGDTIKMTNLDWEFSCQTIAHDFNFEHFVALNDFAAVAAACSQLDKHNLATIKEGQQDIHASRAVFGPGTGLGVAGLIHNQGLWLPVPSEGGHVNIAPSTKFECEVIQAAMTQHQHVSAEVFLSGPGLVNLYRAITLVRGVEAEDLSPSDISEGAVSDQSDILTETLNTFCGFAGSFAGNLALSYGAKGGIYIAGGIFPRFIDFLKASPFVERFQQKGPMSSFVEGIPAYLITHPETAFVGCAAWLEQYMDSAAHHHGGQ